MLDELHAVFTMITFGETNAAFDESALDFLNGATMTQGTLPSVLDPRNGGCSHSRMFGEFFDGPTQHGSGATNLRAVDHKSSLRLNPHHFRLIRDHSGPRIAQS